MAVRRTIVLCLAVFAHVAGAVSPTFSSGAAALRLRGGYDGDGGYGGDGGGGYRGGGGYGGRGGYRGRGRGGFRGRGRGRGPPPDGPIDDLKLYVGGLSWDVDTQGLKDVYAQYGDCEAQVMTDKYSGRSRGFGFVTFTDANAAATARDATNGMEIMGRPVTVNNARQRVEREGEEGAAGGGDGGGGDDQTME